GNIFQLGNGYMGYRGTLDEYTAEQMVGITLAGLYDRVGQAWREPVNAPNGGFTRLWLDGERVCAVAGKVKHHRQTLQLGTAAFERHTTFVIAGKELTISSHRFLSASNPHLGVIEYRINCDQDARVRVQTGIDFAIWDLNGPHLIKLKARQHGSILTVAGVTQETGQQVVVAEGLAGLNESGQWRVVNEKSLHEIHLTLRRGETRCFHKFFAVYTDNDRVRSPLVAAIRCIRESFQLGREALCQRHQAEWRRRWEASDVRITGDPAAQQALRYSLFQLLIAAPVPGSANSIPARALSGQVYKGAIFWDTEMFMFPFFVHTQPKLAAELMRYRIQTLPGAKRKARTESTGYRGAFYAWESQETGDEACTYFNIGDPLTGRELRTYFRDKQVHISGDVAIAMWEYFRQTGDDMLLLKGGAEVILECARFYLSRVHYQPDQDRYVLLDVTGPDEYHERVHNNAFTNQVAAATLEIAGALLKHLRRHHPQTVRQLVRRLKLAPDLPLLTAVTRKFHIPRPRSQDRVIEQFDDYFRLEDVPVATVKKRKIHPHEYLGGGQGVAVPTQVIKQADVIMMLNLFKDRYSQGVKRANWEFYEPRTEHGSSLSACAYAMVAADVGKVDWAYKYFLQTAKVDLEAKYKLYVGTTFIGGSHPAANGGAWMTAVFGFGGVRTDERQISLSPRLYRRWAALEFPLRHRGQSFRMRLTHHDIAVEAAASNQRPHRLVIAGRAYRLAPGKKIIVSR
ncbi:MAG TPA: glycosyl hydrolase family 65 protein, partial [Verrucomicrobiae bacterium]